MIEAHQKRLAEIDDEISRIDAELSVLNGQRRANPSGGAADAAKVARRRRQDWLEEREEIAGDIEALLKLERSEERVAQRAHARETMRAALATAEHRQKLAAALDRVGEEFLELLGECTRLGRAAQAAVSEAAQLAVPFNSHMMGDPWMNGLLNQRLLLTDHTLPHAGAFTGPDMQLALAHFFTRALERAGNPAGVARIENGWAPDPLCPDPVFARAAQMANGRFEFGAERIELCLREPT